MRTQPIVMALNIQPPIDSGLVDAFVVCHPVRVLMDAKEIAKTTVPVFAPQEVTSRANGAWEQVDLRDFGLKLADKSSYTSTGCTLPHLEAIAYALAIAGAGGARRVLLSGFDGFGLGDPRQEAMADIFSQFNQIEGAPSVVSVTRTSYAIDQSSIFAPAISRDDE